MIVGNSREPWIAAKKDEKALLGFWTKTLALPVPDYASRRVRALAPHEPAEGQARG
jgi:hypothetical protein